MKRTLVAATAAAFLLAGAVPGYVAAKEKKVATPEQVCTYRAKKEHVKKDMLDGYMKTCVTKVEKYRAKHKAKVAHAATPATPATPAKKKD